MRIYFIACILPLVALAGCSEDIGDICPPCPGSSPACNIGDARNLLAVRPMLPDDPEAALVNAIVRILEMGPDGFWELPYQSQRTAENGCAVFALEEGHREISVDATYDPEVGCQWSRAERIDYTGGERTLHLPLQHAC